VAIPGFILAVLVGYLLGSIPTGFLIGKARGIDIRTVGSGNIGATNVVRSLGKPAGALVLLGDAAKGWLAVAAVAPLISALLGVPGDYLNQEWLRICAGLAALLGHNYTCFLHFKGGKGIATSAGVLAALVPISLLIILAMWIVVFGLTRYVSLASIAASLTLPVATWLTGQSLALILVTSGMTVLAVYKHKANIQRLLNGTEGRMGSKPLAPPGAPNPPL
jgi:glycerol-3-phosphate acyltransferase PlsY